MHICEVIDMWEARQLTVATATLIFLAGRIGSGVDYALGNGLFLRGEYRYSRFREKVEVYDFYRLGFEPERHDWRIGLGYYF